MSKFLKISVVTPSYNQGQYLEETLKSVLNQNYPNLEYIVIDGGSTDNSLEILQKYKKHFSYWISEKDSGQSDAINKGLRKTSGEIITWLNSDDLLTTDSLFKVNDHFNKLSANVGLIHGGTILFDKKGDVSKDFGYEHPTLERYISGMSFAQPSSFFKKRYLEQVGYLNPIFHYGMDYDLFARLSLVCDFHKVNDEFSRYRLHESSKSVSCPSKFIEDWYAVYFSIINNLKLTFVKRELMKLRIFPSNTLKEVNFNFSFEEKKIDEKMTLFYFLCYVLKSDYLEANFSRARKIYVYLKENYSSELIVNEKGIGDIAKRLTLLPNMAIKLLRSIKNKA